MRQSREREAESQLSAGDTHILPALGQGEKLVALANLLSAGKDLPSAETRMLQSIRTAKELIFYCVLRHANFGRVIMKKARVRINKPELLVAWRLRYGLEQTEAMTIFFRGRRAYQNLETGKLKSFPAIIDVLCQQYEKSHKPVLTIQKSRG